MTDLVPSVSIEALIMKRDAMVERIQKAHDLLVETNELAEVLFGDGSRGHRLALRNYGTGREFTSEVGLDDMIKEIDGRAWQYLLRESGLRTFMDSEARNKWNDAIAKNDVPKLTRESIDATFVAMYEARGLMFERGVIGVFRALSWDYKTNNGVMFGKRIILRHISDPVYGVRYDGSHKLDDLLRVMHVLDGKPEPEHRQGAYRRMSDARWPRDSKDIDLDYFSVRGFKNGNGHLTFQRLELVDQMNAILTKHYPGALPASRGA